MKITGKWDGHEFTPAAGTRVHAATMGPPEAPEVVCVHGLGISHRYFLPTARCLAPEHRAVAVDLPGFGRTRGPVRALDVRGLSRALADWLRATDRAGVPLVANSVGCQVVVDLAVHSPELLGPVVLNGLTMDPHGRTGPRKAVRLGATALGESPGLALLSAHDYAVCGPRRLWETFRYALYDQVEAKLPNLTTPTVVVRGSHDYVCAHRWAAQAVRVLPDARLAEVPGAGHALNYSAPLETARITAALIDESA